MNKRIKWILTVSGIFMGWALVFITLITLFGPLTLIWQQLFKLSGAVGAILLLLFLIENNKKQGGAALKPIDIPLTIISYVLGPITLFSVITMHIVLWRTGKKEKKSVII